MLASFVPSGLNGRLSLTLPSTAFPAGRAPASAESSGSGLSSPGPALTTAACVVGSGRAPGGSR